MRVMKKYLKTHTYKKIEFQCVECDFVGAIEETMEVHYGKNHSDSFECGICEYKAEHWLLVRFSSGIVILVEKSQ